MYRSVLNSPSQHSLPTERPKACLPRLARSLLLVLLSSMVPAGAVSAQMFSLERPTLIENVRILRPGLPTLEGARVLIRGGRITEIGSSVEKPTFAKVIDGEGLTVTAGLIDVQGRLAMTRSQGVRADSRAEDSFDVYAAKELRAALAQGITQVCISPGRGDGIRGVSAVVRLAADGDRATSINRTDVALEIDLDSRSGAIGRARHFSSVEAAFSSAIRLRDSREDYTEALEKYEEELKEWAEKQKEKQKEKKEKKEKDAKEESAESDGGKGSKKGSARKGVGKGKRAADLQPRRGRRRGGRSQSGNSPGSAPTKAKDADKKDEAPRKPKPPGRDSQADVVLRAIERELPVRIEARRSADILNALELIAEHRLDAVLVGADDAYLVVDAIVSAKVDVIVDRFFEGDEAPDRWRTVREAGIRCHVGSGGIRENAPYLLLNAERAVASGAIFDALSAVTGQAASFLGLGRGAGRLHRGGRADLVLWRGSPTDPGATVQKVLVGGLIVHESVAEGAGR